MVVLHFRMTFDIDLSAKKLRDSISIGINTNVYAEESTNKNEKGGMLVF